MLTGHAVLEDIAFLNLVAFFAEGHVCSLAIALGALAWMLVRFPRARR